MTPTDTIAGIDIFTLRADVPVYSDARHNVSSRETMWVRLRSEQGATGWAEAALWGGPAKTTAAILTQELFPLVVGEDPDRIHFLWDKLYQQTLYHGRRGAVVAAMSAIDVALWDMLARKCELPLVTLLGRHRDSVLPYASAGFYAPGKGLDELHAEFTALRSEGFRAFKMKVGRQERLWGQVWERPYSVTLDEDIERVFAVRDAIGPDAFLLVDANTEWDAPTAITFLEGVKDANLFFMEEPVGPDHYHQAAEIRKKSNVRVAGFETEYTRFAYRDLIASGAVDIVQPDPCWCGGLSEARRIAAMASAWGRLCVPHSISSAISLLVCVHFVGSLDNGFLVEWDATAKNPWMLDFLSSDDLNADGTLDIPTSPGIGITPDVDAMLDNGDCEHLTVDRDPVVA